MAQRDYDIESIRRGRRVFSGLGPIGAQSGVSAQTVPVRSLQPDIWPATQATPATQPEIVVAHDVGMEADVKSVRKEVDFLKKEMSELKSMIAGLVPKDRVIEVREVSPEDARKEIQQYFEAYGGDVIYPSDVAEALNLDYLMVNEIMEEFFNDGKIRRASD